MAGTLAALLRYVTMPAPRFEPSEAEARRLRSDFVKDGFVRVASALSADEAAAALAAVEELKSRLPDALPRHHQFYDVLGDPGSLKQIQTLNAYHSFFDRLAGPEAMGRLATVLLGEPAVLKNIQYFNKPPGTSKPTPAHQDGFYFMIEPQNAVTMWLALDEADESNGCLVYVKGSGGKEMRPHEVSGVLGFSQKCSDYGTGDDLANEMVMSARVGDLVAHNSLMLHRAGANTTADRQRRAIGFIYYGASARIDADRAEAYQQRQRQALAAAGKI